MRLSTGSPALVASAILCSCEMRADLTSNLCQLGFQCRLSPVAPVCERCSQCRACYLVRAHDVVLQCVVYNLRAKANSLLPSCNQFADS